MQATPFEPINSLLDTLLDRAQDILGEQFVGMYLYGSLSTGDFSLTTSDIDFLIVTTEKPSAETLDHLMQMHRHLQQEDTKWAMKLEGMYMPQWSMRQYGLDRSTHLSVNEGHIYQASEGSDWVIQRHVIREMGIVLAGPDPKTFIDPVSADQIRVAITHIIDGWWLPLASSADLRLNRSDYQAFAVVSMCRILYTMHTGTIASKPISARWAQTRLPDKWHNLIDTALLWEPPAELDLRQQVSEFIHFVVEQVGHR